MNKNLFITGTGTDVGKTYVTALIVKKMKDSGYDAAYLKAAASGNERDDAGNLIPGDAKWVRDIAGLEDSLTEMVPNLYEAAVSPHLASRTEGQPVNLAVVKAYYDRLAAKHRYITMEGSGGILCPIRMDEQELWLEDIIKAFGMASVIVAGAGLGTINHAVLTAEYMKQKALPVKGIILNDFHPGNELEKDNLKMIEHRTGLPVLCCVKRGDTELDIYAAVLASLYD